MSYTNAEANQITQMLKDLAVLKANHPILDSYIDSATEDLVQAREFILGMLKNEA